MANLKKQQTLNGKSVLILGGSSGLGLATAQAAAADGASVVIVSGNQQRLDAALRLLPDNCSARTVDLRSEENIKRLFTGTGPFDHLVYTAGENLNLHNIADTNISEAKDFLTLRFWGALAAIKYGAPLINKEGSIGLISGIASQRPGPGWGMAAAICGAMDGLVRAMAVELAPLRVNAVSAGVIRTNLWNSISEADRESLYATVGASLLVKRVGEAEDIAKAFLFLMKQSFATGQVYTVDGGAVLV